MNVLVSLSAWLLPGLFLGILLYAYLQKIPVFDVFWEGAAQGLRTVARLLPTLIAILVGTSLLRASGLLDALARGLAPGLRPLGFPPALLPLALLRLFSSAGATGLALDLFAALGPDSFEGRCASVLLCCTETVFYTLSVYFSHVGVTRTRYTLPCALLANLAGVLASVWLVRVFF